VYWRIYLPLLAPALAVVGTYALLLSRSEYFEKRNCTLAVALEQFWDSDEAP
jgi:multiple sugar transport system permease protein